MNWLPLIISVIALLVGGYVLFSLKWYQSRDNPETWRYQVILCVCGLVLGLSGWAVGRIGWVELALIVSSTVMGVRAAILWRRTAAAIKRP